MTSASDDVLVERRGAIQVITINRPAVRNAITKSVADGIAAALDELDGCPDLAVAVLHGAGGTFCSGMDLKAFVAGERPIHVRRGFAGLVALPPVKPLVAAVEGFAIAGGCEITLACDVVVAARDARFGLPEVKRGLVAAGGAMFRLPRRIPYLAAMNMALTGELVDAERAREVGLVTRLSEPGQALDDALGVAATIAANGPLAVAASKRIIIESQDWPLGESFARQAPLVDPVRESTDAMEGARAFVEKRPARWQGR